MHLVTAADARTLRPLVQEKLARALASSVHGAVLWVKPFRKLPAAQKNAVLEEGDRLARFLGGRSAEL